MPDRHSEYDPELDQELIALSAGGDRRAFERLVERHAAAVLRLAIVLTDDRASAEDAMQQTFLSAYRSAASFRADASVRTWLLRIVRNTAYRLAAKRGREDLMEEPLMTLGIHAGWGSDNPEALAMAAERRDSLRRALDDLPAADREVLILRDIEGLRGSEAAEVMGIGEPALKSRLHRARLKLAVALRSGVDADAAETEGGAK
jgi:RNA polymerase sigma-70 factor (ECF subfamily)